MYRILIVEDDAGIAGAMKKRMEAWDLEARCVEDFHNVLAEFSDYAPHLILMDISLPFFNGYHWCSEIPQGIEGAHYLCVFRLRQYEYRHGHPDGRR